VTLPWPGEDMPSVVTRPALLFVILVPALFFSSCLVCRPRPSLLSVSPSNVATGSPQFLLTVNGSDFRFDSFVTWNGAFRPTTFVSTHQLVALISATDIAVSSTAQVRVFTPGDGDGTVTVFSTSGIIVVSNTRCGGGNSNVLTVIITDTPVTAGMADGTTTVLAEKPVTLSKRPVFHPSVRKTRTPGTPVAASRRAPIEPIPRWFYRGASTPRAQKRGALRSA
jgi:hypothetical protein